ncbi:hypothetical protein [Zunongwangia atlantica]|uniref:Conjugative transposon protein TraJ n=1 Tax=Zunongwangia atlantica 22II14-10F7 TaxID=1185767 RepID=A0A1Y1T530_9FLAO|nr:hypothetical protein [Zunongwangia atlantica]ORL46146.1 hypothetical protein IIF7_06231 [Zunongwangia atlantica 22II14-10F7]|tara:strand:+ start:8595 stop:9449 length:855 start_codon:yes stop_codon:yes gene_type:complete
MNALLAYSIGLEYVDSVFQIIKDSDFSQYTITGIKGLGVVLFLVNILKKYNEGIADREGYTWGLSPGALVKNFAVILIVVFSTQLLGFFDTILVAIEEDYRDTAPPLLPLQLQEMELEPEYTGIAGGIEVAQKALATLYDVLVTPLYGIKMISFMAGLFLWILDLFIYPLFLAERYFLLGLMQAFFPLIISLSVFDKFRSMAYQFFRLYTAVYMLVPAFFLVNIFINTLYTQINANFWNELLGITMDNPLINIIIEAGSIGFIVFLKFKLYKKATSFSLRLFTS